jgi:hypothetical protein
LSNVTASSLRRCLDALAEHQHFLRQDLTVVHSIFTSSPSILTMASNDDDYIVIPASSDDEDTCDDQATCDDGESIVVWDSDWSYKPVVRKAVKTMEERARHQCQDSAQIDGMHYLR